ncbi:MAG: hypothetical protein AB3N12_12090 [Ruegeria sp.]
MTREDFSDKTKRTIAQRAAYRCSFPNCGRLTVGPGQSAEKIDLTGQAAHIYSASMNGPRGQDGLPSDQIKAASNGIWMCGEHASLIDKNKGVRYPASVVKGWKALHEHRTAFEHTGGTSAFGFVRSLRVVRSNIFEPESTIELGKTTFLVGENDSGKSAICEWLSIVDTFQFVDRWVSSIPLDIEVKFDCPIEHTLSVCSAKGSKSLQVKLDGEVAAYNHHRISVVYVEERGQQGDNDDLEYLSRILSIDAVTLRSLTDLIADNAVSVKEARFERERNCDGKLETVLYCSLTDGASGTFGVLSSGEKGRVIIDFAIALMQVTGRFAPALLILEWPGLGLDEKGFEKYVEYFSSSHCTFQTVITTFYSSDFIEGVGWQSYQLSQPGENGRRRIQPTVPNAQLS